MNVAVVIPWRDKESRRYGLKLVQDWYAANLPDAEILLADTDDEPFNLSAARNKGVRELSDRDVVIINDADTLPSIEPLREAIEECATSGVVHLPYFAYHSLGVMGTQAYLRDQPLDQCPHLLVYGACSGVYVTTPETWWMHGGQDENFRGWGFEDAAWLYAHTTLLGEPPRRHEGSVYSLHHESATKQGENYTGNAYRCALYENANGNYDAMHDLVFGDTE